jgi:hypothetical protein
MFFRDLEMYRYAIPAPLKDVVAVGWLSRTNDYPIGDAPSGFVDALARLLPSYRVNQTRGFHECEFCSKSPFTYEVQPGKTIVLGSAEIWVPSADQGMIYAAPDLVYHYVKEHRYLPPANFIQAVMAGRGDNDWDANQECQWRLNAAFRT